MMDDRLRAADPAAGWRAEPDSRRAEQMLATIVATPRDGGRPELRPGTRRPRRLVLGAAALSTLAAAGVVGTTVWGGGSGRPDAAYAVTANVDGSVRLTIRWEQLRNPAGVVAALREAGVPTVTSTGVPTEGCATAAERERAEAALSQVSPGGVPASYHGYVLRPRLFPAGSSIVISAQRTPEWSYTLIYLAATDAPSCALGGMLGAARYVGPSPHPTRVEFPPPTAPR